MSESDRILMELAKRQLLPIGRYEQFTIIMEDYLGLTKGYEIMFTIYFN